MLQRSPVFLVLVASFIVAGCQSQQQVVACCSLRVLSTSRSRK